MCARGRPQTPPLDYDTATHLLGTDAVVQLIANHLLCDRNFVCCASHRPTVMLPIQRSGVHDLVDESPFLLTNTTDGRKQTAIIII